MVFFVCDSWYCVLFVHVDYGTACVTYVDIAVHSNVFWGATVGTVCYLSMCTMEHPVSHNYVDLAVHSNVFFQGGGGGGGSWYCVLFVHVYYGTSFVA